MMRTITHAEFVTELRAQGDARELLSQRPYLTVERLARTKAGR